MLTLIGTPPNLVIAEAWEEFSGEALSMFSFLPAGLVCLAAGTLLLIPLSKMLSGKKKNSAASDGNRTLADIVEEYNLNHDLWRVDVPSSSLISGLSLGALSLRSNYGLDVLELRVVEGKGLLKNVSQEAPSASSVIESGDILFIRGPRENVDRFVADYGLRIADDSDESRRHLDFYDIGLAEIVVLPNSGILKETIAGLDFRNRYNVNILGVRRGGNYITGNLGDRKVAKGDVLLVQGTWDSIGKISRDTRDWVVLGEPESRASKVTIDYKAPIAAVIMLAMILALVFSSVPAVFVVLTASVLMMLTGCFRTVADAYRTINWESVVLIAFRPGKDGSERDGERFACRRARRSRPAPAYGGDIFHHLVAHHVHLQHGHQRADGPDCGSKRRGLRSQPASDAFRRHIRSVALLHVALLDSAKRSGHAGRSIHIHGLCEGWRPVADSARHPHDIHHPAFLPLLIHIQAATG